MFHFSKISIKNFKSIKNETIDFGKNKTVFVGKNSAGKTNVLYAVEKLFNPKNHHIKKSDFLDKKKTITIRAQLIYNNIRKEIVLKSKYRDNKVISIYTGERELLNKIDLIYISSDRRFDKQDPENGYFKLINLILENKKNKILKGYKTELKDIKNIHKGGLSEQTTLFISLLKLYLYSISGNGDDHKFKLFVIDQPENFLHPHGTKLIDRLLQQIGESYNTQILYSTHSTELVSNFKKGSYELSDIVFVNKKNGYTHTRKIENKYGKYNKIMINLIFKNASVFFSDAVILVEGETEKISIPNIYENWDWLYEEHSNDRSLKDKYNLDLRNINVIDVGGKGALCEWFKFASEVFGKENVFAMIDRDPNFSQDKTMISKTIKQVYGKRVVDDRKFGNYNWIILDGEFESYYKPEMIRNYLRKVILKKSQNFGENLDQDIVNRNLKKLDERLEKVQKTRKISKAYSKLFNKYFHKYGKPTIAFNLSIWLSQNKGFKNGMIKSLKSVIEKINREK